MSSLILDNEAVQALMDAAHPKHRRALGILDEANRAAARRRGARTRVLVPVAVRVEARWDRTDRGAANVNRLTRAHDVGLDGTRADRATQLARVLDLSVVDATVAQAAEEVDGPVRIVTSDRADMHAVAGHLDTYDHRIRVIAL